MMAQVTYCEPNVPYVEHVRVDGAIRIWEIRSGDLLASLPVGGPGGAEFRRNFQQNSCQVFASISGRS